MKGPEMGVSEAGDRKNCFHVLSWVVVHTTEEVGSRYADQVPDALWAGNQDPS